MKKILTLFLVVVSTGIVAQAQKVTTSVIDKKGTIKWVIDSTTAVITKGDSTLLYVTPSQLSDSLDNNLSDYVKYSDTAAMLSLYVNATENGITKTGQSIKLGGSLSEATTITTTASNFLAITGLQAGNTDDSVMIVNPSTGQVKFMSASSLFNALTFSNGLTKTGNDIKLGGTLTEAATTITTDGSHVLQIPGLQSGSTSTDSIMVANGADGTLKMVDRTTILQSGDTKHTIDVTNISSGTYPITVAGMPATASKVWVFRNGAKLLVADDYTAAAGTLTLTAAMTPLLVNGDTIEVQWVK